MPTKILTVTQDGLDNLKAELKELKETKRPEIIERIKRAKEFGDLSENAEYQTAKEDQSFIEGRIQEVEAMLKIAKVTEKKANGSEIGLGSKVTVSIDGEEVSYEVVGPTEGNLEKNKLSNESPFGRSLLGHKKGDTVTVLAPGGEIEYKIVSVQ